MKQRIYILFGYFLFIGGILGSFYLIHQIILTGRTIFLSGEAVGGVAIDHQGRVWARTSDGVSMIAGTEVKSYELNGAFLGWPSDFLIIRIDKNDQVWVVANAGDNRTAYENCRFSHMNAAGLFRFDGSDWILEANSCLPDNGDKAITITKFFDYGAFSVIGPTSSEHYGDIVGDEQGNVWVGTASGLIRFSPDFRPAPFPLAYLHIFLSTGGYWFLGLILTGLYGAFHLDVLRQVSLGIGLGLGVFVLSSGLFEYPVIVATPYGINPGVFSTLGGIAGGLIGRRIVHDRGKEMSVTIIGTIIGSVIGICPTLPWLFAQ